MNDNRASPIRPLFDYTPVSLVLASSHVSTPKMGLEMPPKMAKYSTNKNGMRNQAYRSITNGGQMTFGGLSENRQTFGSSLGSVTHTKGPS